MEQFQLSANQKTILDYIRKERTRERIVRVVVQKGDATLKQLSRYLHLRESTVQSQLDKLTGEGILNWCYGETGHSKEYGPPFFKIYSLDTTHDWLKRFYKV